MKHLLLGTTKGLCVFEINNHQVKFIDIFFKGLPVSMVYHDPVTRQYWVGLSMKHWGPKLFASRDGRRWIEITTPRYPSDAEISPGKSASLRLIWSAFYQPEVDRLWIGTEPGGLFEGSGGGNDFVLNSSLWHHPTRKDHWFGGGRNDAGIHTILGHPNDPDFLLIGVSCGGVYLSRDRGKTWEVKNEGLKADYLPDPFGPFGHDPHAIKICLSNSDFIWQQNHCGVFLSKDGGNLWSDVTPSDESGRYGFCLAIDHEDPYKAWIIPAESDDQRVARNLRLTVCKTDDGGQTWSVMTDGLPQKNCFDLVFRHALDRVADIMAFGTTTGNLFVSFDDGDHWIHTQSFLPPIHSVLIINE